MLDINFIRDNINLIKDICQKKKKNVDVDLLIEADIKKRSLQKEIDELKSEQKKAGESRDIEKAKELKTSIQEKSNEYEKILSEYNNIMETLPNLIHKDVPIGKDECENVVIKKVGQIPIFDFEPLDHEEIGLKLDMIDKEKASKVTGSRFYYIKGDFVLLQNALVQFAIDTLTDEETLKQIIKENSLNISSKPFVPVIPPLMVSYETMQKMGRLHPKDDRYCHEEDKQVMIGSAEHCLGPIHMDEILKHEECTKRYFAYTPAFRREAGTYGKDTRGIFRVHQFDKIEMETFTLPEYGEEEQNLLIAIQEYFLQSLKLPYQKVAVCTGDMGNMDYRQIDMEVYFPGQGKYRETHTSDWMTDFQSRRLNTKVEESDGTKVFCSMNDATAMAFPRLLVAVIENYQQQDGSVKVPEVLKKYMKKDITT